MCSSDLAGGAEDDAGLAGAHGEGDVIEGGRVSEVEADVFEAYNAGVGTHCAGRFTKTWVMMALTTMIHSEDQTTALVVERPTPCVPPVVRIP